MPYAIALGQIITLTTYYPYYYKTKLESLCLSCKVTAVKQQISKFYPQIQLTDASDHIFVVSKNKKKLILF